MALTKKDISELLDEKLEPIKKDISTLKVNSILMKKDVTSIKNELQTVKKIVSQEFVKVDTRLDRLEDISLAVVEDHNEHDARLKRLEKQKKVSSSN